mmetsp:Transcript_146908/g.208268  ORF Transcript_146908/g.208268 Transcript_146908/m.208268 type:complete len:233 (+) Transcript_146908:54-752(+)|eukprot:s4434_g2.t1
MAMQRKTFARALLALALFGGLAAFVQPRTGNLRSQRGADSLIARQGSMIEVPGGLKNGIKIVVDDTPVKLISFQSKKQGKGVAITKAKIQSMITGAIFEKTLNSGSKFNEVETQWQVGTYSYRDESDNTFHIMDMETFEDNAVPASLIGDIGEWLTEGMQIEFERYEGKVIDIQVPDDIILEVTEIVSKKDSGKDALVQLENGVNRQAPAYIKVGDKVQINKKTFEIQKRVD